jgi:uncharacterized glyoxalase superfamily protein PhnB
MRTGISFATQDIHAWCAGAKQRGVRILAEPAKQAWGGVLARFADPDGNQYTVTQADGQAGQARRKSG